MLKSLWYKYGTNPLDKILRSAKREGKGRFLICWNRGLGDIPLGLYALLHRIRHYIPAAEVSFLTRSDLKAGFEMLKGVSVFVAPEWKRGVPFNLDLSLQSQGLKRGDFDLIFESPDPTRWLRWQLGELIPRLKWNGEWDLLHTPFNIDPDRPALGVHVQTETSYTYEKNWPLEYWKELFERVTRQFGVQVLLFGFAPTPPIAMEGVVDLRGKTHLYEMLALIKNRCRYLLVPDSGVLSITYYIDAPFALDVVSLWADPKQGVLKQNVPSPNPLLSHRPLIAKDKDLRTVSVDAAIETLFLKETC